MEKRRKKEEEEEEQQVIEGLPNDLLREILSRLPYQSLCRSKCVSAAWLALCSDPAVGRRRSPQTLSGFFGLSHSGSNRFVNFSVRGRPLVDPSLPFLHGFENVKLLNCCGGILLCHGMRADGAEYIVCNPATEEIWAVLPVPDTHETPRPQAYRTICLCFDPIVPSRFAVFVIIDNGHDITIMEVYSSDTGEWTSMSSRWGHRILLYNYEPGYFFLNGTLHSVAFDSRVETFDSNGKSITMVVTVDMNGNTWRTTRQPPIAEFAFIGFSQGRLHGIEMEDGGGYRISVWILEDYASGQWTLKLTTSMHELLGKPCLENEEYYVFVALHPECNLIFLNGGVKPEHTLMSYDMIWIPRSCMLSAILKIMRCKIFDLTFPALWNGRRQMLTEVQSSFIFA